MAKRAKWVGGHSHLCFPGSARTGFVRSSRAGGPSFHAFLAVGLDF